jgi:SAM-dependent methyltransferase
MKVFDNYARYYDLLYRDKDYGAEARFVFELIRKHAPGAQTVLELGSGTGAHARHLAELGLRVHGIDLSEQMLQMARAKVAGLPPQVAGKLTFSRGDAGKVRLDQTFDAVIALFHVVSYQVSNADLAAIFATTREHLKDEGIFIFDFWYGPAVLTERPARRVKRMEDEIISVVRFAEPLLHANDNVVNVNYQIFITDRRRGGVQTFQETHRMRYLFRPEIDLLLTAAGLSHLEYGEWLTGREPGLDTWSVYSVGKK